MSHSGEFEIQVSGVARTFRGLKECAVYAGRVLKFRDKASDVTIFNRSTREWATVRDIVAEPVWQQPGMPEAKPR